MLSARSARASADRADYEQEAPMPYANNQGVQVHYQVEETACRWYRSTVSHNASRTGMNADTLPR